MRITWALLFFFACASAQNTTVPAQTNPDKDKEIEDGIPITSELVRKTCGGCHKVDDKLRMSRISYRRTTPEGWEFTIKRMIELNHLRVEPAAAREIVKYLSNHLGLAPEEAKAADFEAERRMIEWTYKGDHDTGVTCSRCHSLGRVISQRRTKGEWELLIAMHRGYYPLVDFQAFRRMGPPQTEPGPDGRPPDNRHPMDKAIAHLASAFPLKTPEWSAWSANVRPAKLEGRWTISGYQAGKGPIYGEMTIEPGATGTDEFTTRASYIYALSGKSVTRDGKAIVYTGFQWRGRSFEGASDKTPFREVLFVDRNRREMSGRWFNGAYNGNGIDVTLERVGADPIVLGVDHRGLKTGGTQRVRIYGANLPASLAPSGVDFGQGVKVLRVVSATAEAATVEVEVAANATVGARDVFAAGASVPSAAVVYDKIDQIKVRPMAGMARIGGIAHPKQFQQFEAIAYHNGPDGKPDTKDDIEIGPVTAAWNIDEYAATYHDDDKAYVGSIDQNGLFTPNVDGPNPARRNHANNVGDVWVVATFTPSGKDAKTLRARAHLLVTVPLYVIYDQPEVGQ